MIKKGELRASSCRAGSFKDCRAHLQVEQAIDSSFDLKNDRAPNTS